MKYLLIILLFIGQTLKAQVIILDENRKVILKEDNGNPEQDRIHFKESELDNVFTHFDSELFYVIRKVNGKEIECKALKQEIM